LTPQSAQAAIANPPATDARPYVVRTYDRWIILVIVLVVGWLLFRPMFAFTVYYRGLSFERVLQLPSAMHYYIKSTRIDKNVPQGWQGWAELVMMRAPSDESQRQLALSILHQGISYNPKYGPLAFDLGRTYYMGHEYGKAADAFYRSAQLMPSDMFSWDFAAWSSFHAGELARALRYWHEVLRIDPGNAVAHRQIARYGG
jgi:tetratricopeptide (TPR) repeat protein